MEERFQGNTILIACGSASDPLVGILAHRYQARMWHIATATSRAELFDKATGPDSALLVLDQSFPADGGAAVVELHLRSGGPVGVPIVRCLTQEKTAAELQTFRVIADAEVIEPCEISELFGAIDRLLEEGREQLKREQSVLHFRFPGEGRYLDEACELVARMLQTTGLGDMAQVAACTAFREAVSGSIRHGRHPAGIAPLIQCRTVVSPAAAVFRVAAPPGSGPWFDGSVDHKSHGRTDSLGLIRRCATEVRVGTGGDSIELHCRKGGM